MTAYKRRRKICQTPLEYRQVSDKMVYTNEVYVWERERAFLQSFRSFCSHRRDCTYRLIRFLSRGRRVLNERSDRNKRRVCRGAAFRFSSCLCFTLHARCNKSLRTFNSNLSYTDTYDEFIPIFNHHELYPIKITHACRACNENVHT